MNPEHEYTEEEMAEMQGLMAEVEEGPNGIFGPGSTLVERIEDIDAKVHAVREHQRMTDRTLSGVAGTVVWNTVALVSLAVAVVSLAVRSCG